MRAEERDEILDRLDAFITHLVTLERAVYTGVISDSDTVYKSLDIAGIYLNDDIVSTLKSKASRSKVLQNKLRIKDKKYLEGRKKRWEQSQQ